MYSQVLLNTEPPHFKETLNSFVVTFAMEKLVLKLPDIVDADKSKFEITAELDLA